MKTIRHTLCLLASITAPPLFDGDVTIVMGVETVVPRGSPMAGKSVQRRYTNIWKLENGAWRLIARQATMLPTDALPSIPPSQNANVK